MTKYETRVRSGGNGAGSRNSVWTWEVVDLGPPMVSIDSGETIGAESRAYEAAAAAIERHRGTERQRTLRTPKRPRDTNQLAKSIVDLATGDTTEPSAKVMRAQKAGAKGGPARARSLTPQQRSEIATLAAQARWKKSD